MGSACDAGAINNWNLSEATGAFYVSLAMQNLASAERFFSGPSGIEDQLAKGTMDDGWWYVHRPQTHSHPRATLGNEGGFAAYHSPMIFTSTRLSRMPSSS